MRDSIPVVGLDCNPDLLGHPGWRCREGLYIYDPDRLHVYKCGKGCMWVRE